MKRGTIAAVLFALAVGLKVLLPAGALAYASHAPNQEAALQDCLSAIGDGAAGHAHPVGKGERHAAGCPLCQLSSEGAVALTGREPLRAPVASFDRAAPIGTASSAAPATSLASAHQPRAPPLF
ncbi:MAG: hypothetical protein WAK01_02300 [Methylocystis sp.]